MRDFHYTVDVLVQAYIKDTLKHGTCRACAVGNILRSPEWIRLFFTDVKFSPPKQLLVPDETFCIAENDDDDEYVVRPLSEVRDFRKDGHKRALKIVKDSGYTIHELAKIEFAFETASDLGDRMFNGLMAVVDVLADIHNIDLSVREEAKLLFVKV